jgi:hypothetical protein
MYLVLNKNKGAGAVLEEPHPPKRALAPPEDPLRRGLAKHLLSCLVQSYNSLYIYFQRSVGKATHDEHLYPIIFLEVRQFEL